MSKVVVQCQGSGRQTTASMNAKRAPCPSCGRMQDLTNTGRVRKHTRIMRKSQLKRS